MIGIAEIRKQFPMYQDVPDGELVRALHRKYYAEMPYGEFLRNIDFTKPVDPTADMSGLEKFNAGMGKAFVDLGRGGAQLVGMGPNAAEVREQRALDAPLMRTGAGLAGNVAGNVAAFAPAAVVPGAATIPGAAALGAATGAFQPSEGAGERVRNMAAGGALGGAVQGVARYPMEIVQALGGVKRGAQALVEPFTAGGRERILSRVLQQSTGGRRADIEAALANARELVPGSAPTAAEATRSPGIAALQRANQATNPAFMEAAGTRAAQQNEARVAEILDLAGTQGARTAATSARDRMADALYGQARTAGIDPAVAQANQPLVQNLVERMPKGVLEKARELARINGEVMGPEGSVNGLHYIKLAVDDMISGARETGMGNVSRRALTQFKDDLLTTIDQLSPAYGAARQTYQQMSQPVNQMQVAQAIADRSINPLTGQMQPQAFARALSDDTAQAVTGFPGATLTNTFTPQQMNRLGSLQEDLARSVAARDLGRGPGSDTVQKLAMSNLQQQAGLPESVLRMPVLGRVGQWAYSGTDDLMRQRLADALMNPQQAARVYSAAEAVPMLTTDPRLGTNLAMLARVLGAPAALPALEAQR